MSVGLLSIGDARLELFRLHAMRSVNAISDPVQAQRQQARAELEVSRVTPSREVGVASGASGLAQGCPWPAERNKNSQNGKTELHLSMPLLDGSSQTLQVEPLDSLDPASVGAVDHHIGETPNPL